MSHNQNISNKGGGIGVGSASIVLIFTVICLTVFSLITYIVASNNKTLVDAEAELVTGYYTADTCAEYVLSTISESQFQNYDSLPDKIIGVDITYEYSDELNTTVVQYFCPISDTKALYVNIAMQEDSLNILAWHMVDLHEWSVDTGVNVWSDG